MSKDELQYLLTNKVSIEEVRTLLDGKANIAEVGEDIQQLTLKIEDRYTDLKEKINWMAQVKDLSSLIVAIEAKADITEVNE